LVTNKTFVAVVDSKETNTWVRGTDKSHAVSFIVVYLTKHDGSQVAIYEENADVNTLTFLLSLKDKEEYDLSSAARSWKQRQR
jgi:hypothetical protein